VARDRARATTAAPWGLAIACGARNDFRKAATRRASPSPSSKRLDWARIDRIPPLAEPTRLPPGGGTAVLNLIAELARAQGVARLAYRGPYPPSSSSWRFLESFRYAPADATDPLAAFMAGELAWTPAPHERLFVADGLYVQRRARVEKVVFRGAATTGRTGSRSCVRPRSAYATSPRACSARSGRWGARSRTICPRLRG